MELSEGVLLGTAGRALRSVSEWRVVSHLGFLVLAFLVLGVIVGVEGQDMD